MATYLSLTVLAFTTVTTFAYYKRCYKDLSICLTTHRPTPYHMGDDHESAYRWCRNNASSLVEIQDENVQAAIINFTRDLNLFDSNALIITDAYVSRSPNWTWIDGGTIGINESEKAQYLRYAYLRKSREEENSPFFLSYDYSYNRKMFICSYYGSDMKYYKWAASRPYSSEMSCMCLQRWSGYWTDCDCFQKYRFICIQDYDLRSMSTIPGRIRPLSKSTVPREMQSETEPKTLTSTVYSSTTAFQSSSNVVDLDEIQQISSPALIGIGIGIVVLLLVAAIVFVTVYLIRDSRKKMPSIRSRSGYEQSTANQIGLSETPNSIYAQICSKPDTAYGEVIPTATVTSDTHKIPAETIYADLDLIPTKK